MLEYDKLSKQLKISKDELCETKNKLNKAGNDIDKKMKYIDELKEIEEKFDNQSSKLTKLINEVNEKNNNISKLKDNVKDLEEEKNEIINKSNKKIQGLEKKPDENERYFNNYEEDRIKIKEKINKLNILNKELNDKKNNRTRIK